MYLATLLLEFDSLEECYKAIHFLKDFIHHEFYNCSLHDESYAFYFEHWARHNHFSKPPLNRPGFLYD